MAEGKGYGFHVTNKATQKIATAMKEGTKVELKQVAFGTGGDPEENWNYDRTALNTEATRKNFDSINDKYIQDTSDPSQVIFQVMVPDEYTGAVTEIGFFDTDNELFAYSCVPDKNEGIGKTDPVPTHIVYNAYVKLEPEQADTVEINIVSGDFEVLDSKIKQVQQQVTEMSSTIEQVSDLEPRVQALETTLEGLAETLESLI